MRPTDATGNVLRDDGIIAFADLYGMNAELRVLDSSTISYFVALLAANIFLRDGPGAHQGHPDIGGYGHIGSTGIDSKIQPNAAID